MSQEEESKEYDVSTLTWIQYAGGALSEQTIPIKNGAHVVTGRSNLQLRDPTGANRVTPNTQYVKDYTLTPQLAPDGFRLWYYYYGNWDNLPGYVATLSITYL